MDVSLNVAEQFFANRVGQDAVLMARVMLHADQQQRQIEAQQKQIDKLRAELAKANPPQPPPPTE